MERPELMLYQAEEGQVIQICGMKMLRILQGHANITDFTVHDDVKLTMTRQSAKTQNYRA